MNFLEADNVNLDWIILKKSKEKASVKNNRAKEEYQDTRLNCQQLGTVGVYLVRVTWLDGDPSLDS